MKGGQDPALCHQHSKQMNKPWVGSGRGQVGGEAPIALKGDVWLQHLKPGSNQAQLPGGTGQCCYPASLTGKRGQKGTKAFVE